MSQLSPELPPENRVQLSVTPMKVEVTNTGQIKIGSRYFNVKVGGNRISNQDLLVRVQNLVNEHFNEGQSIDASIKAIESKGQKAGSPGVSIRLGKEGVTVSRAGGQEEVNVTEGAKYGAKQEKIHTLLKEEANFVSRLKAALIARDYSKADVQEAIKKIRKEPDLSYVYYIRGVPPPEWGDKTLGFMQQERGNEALYSVLDDLKERYAHKPAKGTTHAKECENELRLLLIRNSEKSSKMMEIEDDKGEFLQRVSEGNSDEDDTRENPSIERYLCPASSSESPMPIVAYGNFARTNRSIPSSADRGNLREEASIYNHNVNMRTVTFRDANGEIHPVCFASGRSDTSPRLKEIVVEALLGNLSTDHPLGLSQGRDARGNPVWEFRHAITTHMDISSLKAVTTPENERQAVKDMLKALKEWPAEGYKVVIEIGGESRTVILKRPMIREELFSATVKGLGPFDLGKADADHINFVPHQQLFSKYLERAGIAPSESLIQASAKLNEKLQEITGKKEDFRKDGKLIDFDKLDPLVFLHNPSFFKSKRYLEYTKEVAKILLEKVTATLQPAPLADAALGLYGIMFRKALPSATSERVAAGRELENIKNGRFSPLPEPHEEIHPADVEIYSNIVFDALGISCGKQCKSGKDRTAISLSLKAAQTRFQVVYGKPFIPGRMNEEETLYFKSYFREFLKGFCSDITLESQGYMGFKWGGGGGNPVVYKYLYNEEDVQNLKKPEYSEIGANVREADVKGLTQADLDARGKEQFKGSLADTRAVYGKSEKKTVREVEEDHKLTEPQRKIAKKEVENFLKEGLKEGLGLKNVFGRQEIINDSLHLAVHIRRLKLTEQDRVKIQKRIDTIEEEIASKSPEEKLILRMQQYALKCIGNLYDQRAKAKYMRKERQPKEIALTYVPSLTSPFGEAPKVEKIPEGEIELELEEIEPSMTETSESGSEIELEEIKGDE